MRLFGLSALCRRIEPKLKSGIVLPDGAKDAADTANVVEVVAVGDGRFVGRDGTWMHATPRLEVGNLVVVNPGMVQPVRLDGKTYVVVEEENVLLVIESGTETL